LRKTAILTGEASPPKESTMSLREVLSANLSRLCEGEVSIAAVCRATRINRQQFNRYLSGASIPNGRNLEKICRYFRTMPAAPCLRMDCTGTAY
jgi:hypothetical protein